MQQNNYQLRGYGTRIHPIKRMGWVIIFAMVGRRYFKEREKKANQKLSMQIL
jgi:hypothetical protein